MVKLARKRTLAEFTLPIIKRLPFLCAALLSATLASAQNDGPPPPDGPRPFGPPGMMAERKIVKQFDKDGDKRLDKTERAEAREFLKKNPPERRGPGGGPGGPGGFRPPGMGGGEDEPVKPGARLSPADVVPEPVSGLYAPAALTSLAAFQKATADLPVENAEPAETGRRRGGMSLREFADQRRAYLLGYEATKSPAIEKAP